jgi:hypothetical protein
LLGVIERQIEPVDHEEADHPQQAGMAVAANGPDQVPGKHARVAPGETPRLGRLAAGLRSGPADRRVGDDRPPRIGLRRVVGEAQCERGQDQSADRGEHDQRGGKAERLENE